MSRAPSLFTSIKATAPDIGPLIAAPPIDPLPPDEPPDNEPPQAERVSRERMGVPPILNELNFLFFNKVITRGSSRLSPTFSGNFINLSKRL